MEAEEYLECFCCVQSVNRRLSTAMAPVQAQVSQMPLSDGQNGNGADFFRVLRFPLPVVHFTNELQSRAGKTGQ
jgi:hypothetical protein